ADAAGARIQKVAGLEVLEYAVNAKTDHHPIRQRLDVDIAGAPADRSRHQLPHEDVDLRLRRLDRVLALRRDDRLLGQDFQFFAGYVLGFFVVEPAERAANRFVRGGDDGDGLFGGAGEIFDERPLRRVVHADRERLSGQRNRQDVVPPRVGGVDDPGEPTVDAHAIEVDVRDVQLRRQRLAHAGIVDVAQSDENL